MAVSKDCHPCPGAADLLDRHCWASIVTSQSREGSPPSLQPSPPIPPSTLGPSSPSVAPPTGILLLGRQLVGFLAPLKIQKGRDETECSQAKRNTRFPSLSLSFQKLCLKLTASQHLARIDSWFINCQAQRLVRETRCCFTLHFLPQLRPSLSQYPLEMLSDCSILSPTERASVLRLL